MFKGKVALVSGASRGVGFALASRLVDEGARVVITARGEQRLASSRAKLQAQGGEVEAVAGDIGEWKDAERMVGRALDRFGRLDILVNNAGVSMRGDFAELSGDVCSRVIATNLSGAVHLSRIAMEPIVAARGSIVFISSIAGLFGLPGASVYCASKKALTGLCESLRLELIPKGVHVGIVYLGYTEHDPEKRILSADGKPVPPDRPAHHTQAQAAERIIDMLKKRKKHLIMTPIGNLGWLAYRLSPALVERAVLWAKASKLGLYQRFS
ncbi:MAG: SDR family oxidoreductase [Deltaproteobacteria bacterium]|nr:SDR family oxidoreductase [Deltaproteobacteria bacterium]